MSGFKLYWTPVLLAVVIAAVAAGDAAATCLSPARSLPVSRVVEIDAEPGPLYGVLTKNAREPNFLRPKEVVLTFDDGPMPWVTREVLATLDRYCAKATFFSVGQMAVAYPETTREIITRGHTLGSHTWSHPLNLRRKPTAAAIDEIERGFAGVATAAGADIAPFFRFPGLSDSPALLAYLQSRHIATFTVDVVTNDSYINDPARLLAKSLDRVEAQNGGIILMHDIKPATAKMLPALLAALADRGYKLVHLVPKGSFEPLPEMMRELAPKVAQMEQAARNRRPVPFYGAVGPVRMAAAYDAPVTQLSAARTDYLAARPAAIPAAVPGAVKVAARAAPAQPAGGARKSTAMASVLHLAATHQQTAARHKSLASPNAWVTKVAAAPTPAAWATTIRKAQYQRPATGPQPFVFKW